MERRGAEPRSKLKASLPYENSLAALFVCVVLYRIISVGIHCTALLQRSVMACVVHVEYRGFEFQIVDLVSNPNRFDDGFWS